MPLSARDLRAFKLFGRSVLTREPKRENLSVVAGMIPAPPRRPRTGFPWFGLVIAIVLTVAGVAYLMGGVHGAVLAGVIYGVVVLPIVFLIFTADAFRRGLRRKS